MDSIFRRLVLPFLAPAVLLGIAAAASFYSPRSVVELSRNRDGNVTAVVERSVLWVLPHSKETSRVVREIALRRGGRNFSLFGDPVVPVQTSDLGHAALLREFLDDSEETSLRIVCHPMLRIELLFGGLGAMLLLGALAGIFFQAQHGIGLDTTIGREHLVDSDAPQSVRDGLGDEQFFTKIRCWQPGTRIHVERNLSLPIYLVMLGLSATVGGVAGAWLLDEWGAIVLGLAGLVAMLAIFERKMYYRKVVLDWESKRLYWSFGPLWRSRAFENIKTFRVVDVPDIQNKHRSALALVLKGRSRTIILIDSLELTDSESQSRAILKPLASELRKSLRQHT